MGKKKTGGGGREGLDTKKKEKEIIQNKAYGEFLKELSFGG